jgi:hypothetical protein
MYGSLGGFLIKIYLHNLLNLTPKPGHFSRTLAKGPNTTTWIWNLHADAHDFDSHTSDLEEISRKVFSAHFGQLGIILIWLWVRHINIDSLKIMFLSLRCIASFIPL